MSDSARCAKSESPRGEASKKKPKSFSLGGVGGGISPTLGFAVVPI